MAAMLLYNEDLQAKVAETYKEGKRPRVLPSCLAMGWIKNLIDAGKFGVDKGTMYPFLFLNDSVHRASRGLPRRPDLVRRLLPRVAGRKGYRSAPRDTAEQGEDDAEARLGGRQELSRLRSLRRRDDAGRRAGVRRGEVSQDVDRDVVVEDAGRIFPATRSTARLRLVRPATSTAASSLPAKDARLKAIAYRSGMADSTSSPRSP